VSDDTPIEERYDSVRHAYATEAQARALAERERDKLRAALTEARNDLVNAQVEATHGITASNKFIDRCVERALMVLDRALDG
jgi:uncharacterized membrane protein